MSRGKDSAEKTQEPTAKRLRDARRDGQIAHSVDASTTLVLAAAAGVIAFAGEGAVRAVASLAIELWTQAAALGSTHSHADANHASTTLAAFRTLADGSLALVAAIAAAGVAADLMQNGGLLWASKRIAPDAQRLNPAQGMQRLVSMRNVVEAGKAIVKTALLLVLLVVVVRHALPDLLRLIRSDAATIASVMHHQAAALFGWTAAAFVAVAFGDILWQRLMHRRELRMSKDELKREHKEDEGDPMLKGQRRRLQRQWASRDALQAVKRASAVVVNPTHIAVALEFDAKALSVPVVSAKGIGREAQQMREAARDAGVPIVRNVALARALDAQASVDDEVPEGLFDAVAQVLAWAQEVSGRMQADDTAR
jgi:type III secretion protein U